jgi:RHS repeat-associated protein
VNKGTQDLTWQREEIAISGHVSPVQIVRYFNAQNAEKLAAFGVEENFYGANWLTNYNQLIQWNSEENRYEYLNNNGQILFYAPETGTEKDDVLHVYETVQDAVSLTGTTLLLPVELEDFSDLSALKIENENKQILSFDAAGRLARVTENTTAASYVSVSYVGDASTQIDKITDGVGREFRFSYESDLLSEIACYTAEDEAIQIGGGEALVHAKTEGLTELETHEISAETAALFGLNNSPFGDNQLTAYHRFVTQTDEEHFAYLAADGTVQVFALPQSEESTTEAVTEETTTEETTTEEITEEESTEESTTEEDATEESTSETTTEPESTTEESTSEAPTEPENTASEPSADPAADIYYLSVDDPEDSVVLLVLGTETRAFWAEIAPNFSIAYALLDNATGLAQGFDASGRYLGTSHTGTFAVHEEVTYNSTDALDIHTVKLSGQPIQTFVYENGAFLGVENAGLSESTTTILGAPLAMHYSYTGGNFAAATYPDGASLTLTYTGANLASVTNLDGHTVTYSYADGTLTQIAQTFLEAQNQTTLPGESVLFTIDEDGKPVLTSSFGRVEIVDADALGRIWTPEDVPDLDEAIDDEQNLALHPVSAEILEALGVSEFPFGENLLSGYNQLLIWDEENARYRYLDAVGMVQNFVETDETTEAGDVLYAPEDAENVTTFVAVLSAETLAGLNLDLPVTAVLTDLEDGRFLCFDALGRFVGVAVLETVDDGEGNEETTYTALTSITYIGDSLLKIDTVTFEDGVTLTFTYDENGDFLAIERNEPEAEIEEEPEEENNEDPGDPEEDPEEENGDPGEDPEEEIEEENGEEPDEEDDAEREEIHELNAWGQPTSKGVRVGNLTLVQTFAYTVNGNYAALSTDENGAPTSVSHNPDNGQKEFENLADTTPVRSVYDASGALAAVTQAVAGLTNGTTLSNQYTRENDRLVAIARDGVLYEFTYDAFGNALASKVDGETYWENSYSGAAKGEIGQLIYANGQTVRYTYEDGNLATVSYDEGDTIAYAYAYDEAGKLVTITDNLNDRVSTYGHEEYGESYYEIADKDGNIYYRRGATGANSVTEEFFGLVFTLSKESSTDAATGNTTTNSTADLGGQSRSFSRVEDIFGRSIQKQARGANGDIILDSAYTYRDISDTRTTKQIATQQTTDGNGSTLLNYSVAYDERGNIATILQGGEVTYRYKYNDANMLVREDNAVDGKTSVFVYDVGGNRTSTITYAFTLADALQNPLDTEEFVYDGDRLIQTPDGTEIAYDEIGNALKYSGRAMYDMPGDGLTTTPFTTDFTWQGRNLASASGHINLNGAAEIPTEIAYGYDADGLRARKTLTMDSCTLGELTLELGEFEYQYIWDGNKFLGYDITAPTFFEHLATLSESEEPVTIDGAHIGMRVLYSDEGESLGYAFAFVDGDGNVGMADMIWYIKNAVGDIQGLYSETRQSMDVLYTYDAWGVPTFHNLIPIIGGAAGMGDLGALTHVMTGMLYELTNQLTYRGYFYDFETGLYYLQSRYYAPNWGRFVNADKHFDTGDGILGTNMYIYCLDNPIMLTDPSGEGVGVVFCENDSKILNDEYVVYVGSTLTIYPNFQDIKGSPNFSWSKDSSDTNISFQSKTTLEVITINPITPGKTTLIFKANTHKDITTIHVLTKPTEYNIEIPVVTNEANVYLYNGTNKSNGLNLSKAGTELTVLGGSGDYFAVRYDPLIRYVAKSKVKPKTPFAVDEIHFIKNVYSGKYVDVRGGSTATNTAVQQYIFNGTRAQQWKLAQTAGGFVVFRPQNDTGNTMVMSAQKMADAQKNGTQITIQAYGSTYVSRRWVIVPAGGGNHRIITYSSVWQANAPKCLEVQSGNTDNGKQLGLYAVEETNWQKWKFTKRTNLEGAINMLGGFNTAVAAKTGTGISISSNNVTISTRFHYNAAMSNDATHRNALIAGIQQYWGGTKTIFGFSSNVTVSINSVTSGNRLPVNYYNTFGRSSATFDSDGANSLHNLHDDYLDLYRGDNRVNSPTDYPIDEFRWVAAHEFGHTLGVYDMYVVAGYANTCSIYNDHIYYASPPHFDAAQGCDFEKVFRHYITGQWQFW